jgi:5-dehydro-4-deoxyglucarate dehydratase
MDPAQLKTRLGQGLLAFPATHFTNDGVFDEIPYRASIHVNLDHDPAGLFAPGGTGEFFSLTREEVRRVAKAAVEETGGKVPIVSGVGYGTAMAVELARDAETVGADGLLVLPPYLMNAEQDGLYEHIRRICAATGLGVIVYNRDNCLIAPETLARLAEACPNLIGFKDGHGNVEQLVAVRQHLGDRLVYIGGMPTAEVFAVPYLGAGFTTYSSAVFNFVPKTAQRFYRAVRAGDTATTDALLQGFFLPYLALRNRKRGYAVSIVKAGMRLVGRSAGPVRSPLTDLTAAEDAELRAILQSALGDNPA